MRCLRLTAIILVGSAPCAAAISLPRPRKYTAKALLVRGGAGPLDPTAVAKTALALGGIQGGLNLLCPEAILKGYGWAPSAENLVVMKWCGYDSLASTFMNCQVLLTGRNVNTAVASRLIIHMVMGLAALINEDLSKIGFKSNGMLSILSWLAYEAGVLYGLGKNMDWAISCVKFDAIFTLLLGGMMAVVPTLALKWFGRDNEKAGSMSTELSLLVENQGAILVGGAAMTYALASGVDVTRVIGYGYIPFVLTLIKSVFVTKQYQKASMDTAPLIGWIVMATVFIAKLSF